jgi:CBS domain-containing protein
MTAAEIMTREVVTAGPESTVEEIARLLSQHRVSGLPVVDPERHLLGMVTEGDLVIRAARPHFPRYIPFLEGVIFLDNPRHFEEELRRMMAVTAREIMSTEVLTVSPLASLEDMATLMSERDVNRLVVVDQDRVVGIVARADIVRTLAAG